MMKVHKTKRAFSLLSRVDKVPLILRIVVSFGDVNIGGALVELLGLMVVKMFGRD